jgi:hypothetical protein
MNVSPDPATGGPGFDVVRRKYLDLLHAHDPERAVILYASAFLEGRPFSPDFLVNPLDINGFMSAVSDVQEKKLDLILHTPGGQADAAESIIEYLRTRFDHIRAVIPHMAMSAGTMLALGCDEVVMAAHSQLGPIDPQFTIPTPNGTRSAPAAEILNQFEKAKDEIAKDPNAIVPWSPILAGFGPGLLSQCDTERQLAEDLVSDWLKRYMLKGEPSAAKVAGDAATWFSNYEHFKNHGRPVHRDKVRGLGLKVTDLEADQIYQDLVLSIHHSTMLLLNVGVQKIVENHHGTAFIRTSAVAQGPQIQLQLQPTPGP